MAGEFLFDPFQGADDTTAPVTTQLGQVYVPVGAVTVRKRVDMDAAGSVGGVLNIWTNPATSGEGVAYTDVTGLTIGQVYTASVKFAGWPSLPLFAARIGVEGIGYGTAVAAPAHVDGSSHVRASYQFTATATTHRFNFSGDGVANTDFVIDDFAIVQSTLTPVTITDDFGATSGGWTSANGSSISINSGVPGRGDFWRAKTSGAAQMQKAFAGLIVGQSYLMTLQMGGFLPAVLDAVGWIGISGIGQGAATALQPYATAFTTVSYAFTATATSHTVILNGTGGGNSDNDLVVDDLAITPSAASGYNAGQFMPFFT